MCLWMASSALCSHVMAVAAEPPGSRARATRMAGSAAKGVHDAVPSVNLHQSPPTMLRLFSMSCFSSAKVHSGRGRSSVGVALGVFSLAERPIAAASDASPIWLA